MVVVGVTEVADGGWPLLDLWVLLLKLGGGGGCCW